MSGGSVSARRGKPIDFAIKKYRPGVESRARGILMEVRGCLSLRCAGSS